MKPGLRHEENAACFISICNALPVHMRPQTRELSKLDVPENLRKQGMATRLLTKVTEEADAHGITLILFPRPFGDEPRMNVDQLEEFYTRRFGFIRIQAKPPMMARMPWSTPRFFNAISGAIKGI